MNDWAISMYRTCAEKLIKCAAFWAGLSVRISCKSWPNTCTLTVVRKTRRWTSKWLPANSSAKVNHEILRHFMTSVLVRFSEIHVGILWKILKIIHVRFKKVKRVTGRIISVRNWIAASTNGSPRVWKAAIWNSPWNWSIKTDSKLVILLTSAKNRPIKCLFNQLPGFEIFSLFCTRIHILSVLSAYLWYNFSRSNHF